MKPDILNILNDYFSQQKLSSGRTDQVFDQDITPTPDDGIPVDLDDEADDASKDSETDKTESNYREEFLSMALASLKNIENNVNEILNHIESDLIKNNLTEPWLQGMIAIIEDNMSTIRDFVMLNEEIDDNMSDGSAKNKPGLWENIRKKKERMGRNYKPAKPGDKDRPDPKEWKKLTKDSKQS